MPPSSQSIRSGEGQQRHSHQQTSHARGLYTSSWDGLMLPSGRQRPDILPEHERDYPATAEVRAAIAAEWDGTSGGARDLGQRFTSPVNGLPYPSWRIRDIGVVLRLEAHSQAGDGGPVVEVTPAPAPAPGKRPVRETAEVTAATTEEGGGDMATPRIGTTRQAVCVGCGVPFTSTYYGKPQGWTRYHSRVCAHAAPREERLAAAAAAEAEVEAEVVEAAAATPDPAPDLTHAPVDPVDAAPVEVTPVPDTPRTDDAREATCPQCGVVFTARYRGAKRGWPRYCSAVCGGQAQAAVNAAKMAALREAQREAQQARQEPVDIHHPGHAGHAGHPSAPVAVRTLTLPSGSVVTLTMTGNPLALNRDERDFVFALVDEFNAIERMLAHQARQAPQRRVAEGA